MKDQCPSFIKFSLLIHHVFPTWRSRSSWRNWQWPFQILDWRLRTSIGFVDLQEQCDGWIFFSSRLQTYAGFQWKDASCLKSACRILEERGNPAADRTSHVRLIATKATRISPSLSGYCLILFSVHIRTSLMKCHTDVCWKLYICFTYPEL